MTLTKPDAKHISKIISTPLNLKRI